MKNIIKEAVKKELRELDKGLVSETPFGKSKGLHGISRKSVTGDDKALATARADFAIELIKRNLSTMGIDIPNVDDQTTIGYYKALKNFPVKFQLDKSVPQVFGPDRTIEGTASVDKRSTSKDFIMYLNHIIKTDKGTRKSTAEIKFDEKSLMQNLRGTDKSLPMLLTGVEYTVKLKNKNIEEGNLQVQMVGSKGAHTGTKFALPSNRVKKLYKYITKNGKELHVVIDDEKTKNLPKERKGALVVRNVATNVPFGVDQKKKLKRVQEEGENFYAYKQEGGGWEAITIIQDTREQVRKLTFLSLPENKFGKNIKKEDEFDDWVPVGGQISNIRADGSSSWNTSTLQNVLNNRLNSGNIKARESMTKDDTLILYYDSIERDLGTDAILVSASNIVNDFNSGGFVDKKVKVGPKAGGRDAFEKEGVATITLRKVK